MGTSIKTEHKCEECGGKMRDHMAAYRFICNACGHTERYALTRDADYFVGFLDHLANEELFEAADIVAVVEKPHKWTHEYYRWLDEVGP